MSDKSIRAALEIRLAAMSPALATAFENQGYKPVNGTPYQRVHLLTAEPENEEAGGSPFRRLHGLFQITLFYPQSEGPGNAATRAEAIRSQFPRGLSLTSGGVVVTVEKTPYVMAGFNEEGRYVLPVRVPYYANIGL